MNAHKKMIMEGKCPYGVNPHGEIGKCPSGFPGCACMDEIMVDRDLWDAVMTVPPDHFMPGEPDPVTGGGVPDEPPKQMFVDRANRRIIVFLPVSASVFTENGELMRTIREVCGTDAVMSGRVAEALGSRVMAFCAPNDASRWLSELAV